MTALARRRRRSTVIAAGATLSAIAVVTGLTVAGALTLYHSTAGETAGSHVPELVFPDTPTALVAGVDDDGRLASLVVAVVRPDAAGGSLVPVPVSADATSGEGPERLPLAESVEVEGPDVLAREAQVTLSLSFDASVVADADDLAELLEPVGDVTVDLPEDVTDAAGDVVAPAGESTMDADELAAVLTAWDPSRSAADQYLAAEAVWAAVAAAVGDGLAPPNGAASALDGAPTAAAVLGAVFAGAVDTRGLSWTEIETERNPRRADVVVLDRVELSLIFGQIAPGRVSAPNPSLSFRVVAPFSEDQLAAHGWSNADVAYRAVAQIQFLRGNVLSVDTTPDETEEATVLELNDATLTTDGVEELFGDVEVREGESRIVGVDAVLRLGTGYLDFLAAVAERSEVGGAPVEDTPGGGVDPVDSTAVTTEVTTATTPKTGSPATSDATEDTED